MMYNLFRLFGFGFLALMAVIILTTRFASIHLTEGEMFVRHLPSLVAAVLAGLSGLLLLRLSDRQAKR